MRSVLNWKRFQCINLISSIIVLSLLGTSCTIRQLVSERKDLDAIYEGQNVVPNGNIEILDNGQPVRWNWIRIKKLGSEGLVLVSDYSTYEPEETVVRFSSKDLSEKTLVDAETGEKVEPVLGIYNVKIKADRARLFHFGSE